MPRKTSELDNSTSGFPSPLKSPTAIGSYPGSGWLTVEPKVPLPFPRDTQKPLSPLKAISNLWSRLKSPTSTGPAAAATHVPVEVIGERKVPSPLPSTAVIVKWSWLTSTRSNLPSPLRSPTATPAGKGPTGNLGRGFGKPLAIRDEGMSRQITIAARRRCAERNRMTGPPNELGTRGKLGEQRGLSGSRGPKGNRCPLVSTEAPTGNATETVARQGARVQESKIAGLFWCRTLPPPICGTPSRKTGNRK